MSRLVPVPPLPALEDDDLLEEANQIFWSSLLGHIQAELRGPVENILDVGCHHGGLLVRLASLLHPKSIIGIEPLPHPRERALFRLRNLASSVTMLGPENWEEIPSASINLLTVMKFSILLTISQSCFIKSRARYAYMEQLSW